MKTTITELGKGEGRNSQNEDDGLIERPIVSFTLDLTLLHKTVERIQVHVNALEKPSVL